MVGRKCVSLQKTGIPGDAQEKITKDLLVGAVVTGIDTTDSGAFLNGLALTLKDGRVAVLTEECCRGWEGSISGWINIEIDGKDYP
jgi:hypothetical protein